MCHKTYKKITTAGAQVILHKKRGSYLFRLTLYRRKYQVIMHKIGKPPVSRSFSSFSQAVAFYQLVQISKNINKV